MSSLEALLQEGIDKGLCGVCHVGSRTAFDTLTRLIGTLGKDRKTWAEVRAAGGLCNTHAWTYAHMATDVSINDLYQEMLQQVADHLEATGQPTPPPQRCYVCREAGKREREALELWLSLLEHPQERVRYKRGCGLCQAHLYAALQYDLDSRVRDLLREHAVAVLRRLADLLSENVRKHKALLRHEITRAERAAPDLVLWHMAGRPEGTGIE